MIGEIIPESCIHLCEEPATKTPLERRVDQLGRQIARWVLALAAALGVVGLLAEGIGRAPEMIIFAAALA